MAVVLWQIGWSNAELTRRLDIHERTVREILAGRGGCRKIWWTGWTPRQGHRQPKLPVGWQYGKR
jgi:hypothetical protein